MNATIMMQFRTSEDSQKLAALTPGLGELRREMKGLERWMITNATEPDVVAKVRAKMKQTEAAIADVEKQIRTIKEWKRPTHEQLRNIDQLDRELYGITLAAVQARSALQLAESQERPNAAAEARKRLADAEAQYPKALSNLRKAIEKLGLDPTPMCGEA